MPFFPGAKVGGGGVVNKKSEMEIIFNECIFCIRGSMKLIIFLGLKIHIFRYIIVQVAV